MISWMRRCWGKMPNWKMRIGSCRKSWKKGPEEGRIKRPLIGWRMGWRRRLMSTSSIWERQLWPNWKGPCPKFEEFDRKMKLSLICRLFVIFYHSLALIEVNLFIYLFEIQWVYQLINYHFLSIFISQSNFDFTAELVSFAWWSWGCSSTQSLELTLEA